MIKKILMITTCVLLAMLAATLGFGIKLYNKSLQTEKEAKEIASELEEEIKVLNDEYYGTKAYGRLQVIDTSLCNEDGNPIQLKGMSTHGLSWYPLYGNAGALNTIKSYGANVIRVAVYSEMYMNPKYSKNEYMNYLYTTIENALSINMYVIVDWHVLKEENPNLTVDAAKEFFKEISAHYGNHPYILYEICNEPNGDTEWDEVYQYATEVIPVIRNNAEDSIVIVGTPDYCQDVEAATKKPLPYDNIMYAFHMYFKVSEEPNDFSTADYCLKKMDLGIPVFVTEWGLKYDTEKIYSAETDYFIQELEKRNISWCNWSLSNKDESYSFIKSDCDKLSDWSESDLTVGGKLIKKYLGY